MSSRIDELEARRRALLQRCEEQRLELAYRISQIRPAAALTAWGRHAGAESAARHPLAWAAGIGGLALLLFRRRRLLSGVGWITGLLALATRATSILRVLAQLRAVYSSFKATRRR
jgi:hypothetical protein